MINVEFGILKGDTIEWGAQNTNYKINAGKDGRIILKKDNVSRIYSWDDKYKEYVDKHSIFVIIIRPHFTFP